MIELLEGVPGSGKSYHAVAEKLLPAVRAGRRIYVYIENGFHLDRLALFENRPVDELGAQVTVWRDRSDVYAGLLKVEPGSLVLLDEAQDLFRSKEKVPAEILRWLETHRHRGLDIVLMAQNYGQMTLGVNRLVEATTKFRRMDRFGIKGRYQAHVRGNPEETEVIRSFVGRYNPKVYAYYSSYSSGSVREVTKRGGTILRSPTVVVAVLSMVGVALFLSRGSWLSVAGPVAPSVSASTLPPPPSKPEPVAPPSPVYVEMPATSSVVVPEPVRIVGTMTVERDGLEQWIYVLDSGETLTADEVTARAVGVVRRRMVRGIQVLSGSGIVWGGIPEQPSVAVASAVLPAPRVSPPASVSPAPVEPPAVPDVYVNPNDKPILATPEGPL